MTIIIMTNNTVVITNITTKPQFIFQSCLSIHISASVLKDAVAVTETKPSVPLVTNTEGGTNTSSIPLRNAYRYITPVHQEGSFLPVYRYVMPYRYITTVLHEGSFLPVYRYVMPTGTLRLFFMRDHFCRYTVT